MAYDERTADRFRQALAGMDGVSEKKMMGGICFLLNGNMIGGADRTKEDVCRFMFRIGKDNDEAGYDMPGAQAMVQGGRQMRGFFFVDEAGCDDQCLKDWVRLALGFVTTLPPK